MDERKKLIEDCILVTLRDEFKAGRSVSKESLFKAVKKGIKDPVNWCKEHPPRPATIKQLESDMKIYFAVNYEDRKSDPKKMLSMLEDLLHDVLEAVKEEEKEMDECKEKV